MPGAEAAILLSPDPREETHACYICCMFITSASWPRRWRVQVSLREMGQSSLLGCRQCDGLWQGTLSFLRQWQRDPEAQIYSMMDNDRIETKFLPSNHHRDRIVSTTDVYQKDNDKSTTKFLLSDHTKWIDRVHLSYQHDPDHVWSFRTTGWGVSLSSGWNEPQFVEFDIFTPTGKCIRDFQILGSTSGTR